MRRRFHSVRGAAFAAALFPVAVCAGAHAQDPPPARQLIDRFAEASGGEQLWLDREGWHLTGEFTITALGITGTVEIFAAKPDRSYTRIVIPGVGEMLRGHDGTVGWSVNPIEGPRVLSGAELDQLRDEARPASAIRHGTVLTSAETVEKTTVNGEECWKVKLVWKSGRETQDCYSITSGLLIGTWGTTTTTMGSADYSIVLSDYRAFGSYRMPTRIAQTVLGQEQVITTKTFEPGAQDSGRFQPPEAIRALIRGGGA